MLRIGLTGGIGSGKSTVAELFANRNVPVIDTDVIAREVVQPGQPALKEVVQTFGEKMLDSQGQLDRTKLRERVFDDIGARHRLEAILHPRIRAAVKNKIETTRGPYCLVVVPLLIETGFVDLIDRVLVVDTEEKWQLQRTSARDKVPVEAVKKILDVQAKRKERLERADDIISNNGSREELEQQVNHLHARYLELARAN